MHDFNIDIADLEKLESGKRVEARRKPKRQVKHVAPDEGGYPIKDGFLDIPELIRLAELDAKAQMKTLSETTDGNYDTVMGGYFNWSVPADIDSTQFMNVKRTLKGNVDSAVKMVEKIFEKLNDDEVRGVMGALVLSKAQREIVRAVENVEEYKLAGIAKVPSVVRIVSSLDADVMQTMPKKLGLSAYTRKSKPIESSACILDPTVAKMSLLVATAKMPVSNGKVTMSSNIVLSVQGSSLVPINGVFSPTDEVVVVGLQNYLAHEGAYVAATEISSGIRLFKPDHILGKTEYSKWESATSEVPGNSYSTVKLRSLFLGDYFHPPKGAEKLKPVVISVNDKSFAECLKRGLQVIHLTRRTITNSTMSLNLKDLVNHKKEVVPCHVYTFNFDNGMQQKVCFVMRIPKNATILHGKFYENALEEVRVLSIVKRYTKGNAVAYLVNKAPVPECFTTSGSRRLLVSYRLREQLFSKAGGFSVLTSKILSNIDEEVTLIDSLPNDKLIPEIQKMMNSKYISGEYPNALNSMKICASASSCMIHSLRQLHNVRIQAMAGMDASEFHDLSAEALDELSKRFEMGPVRTLPVPIKIEKPTSDKVEDTVPAEVTPVLEDDKSVDSDSEGEGFHDFVEGGDKTS